ncbi:MULTISPECIES: hypothetical protein [Parachlamydia]|uniref:Uncharacterized protein n=2 Tax=Parachlamydia acanthamoebae TaxID=83552 RepID=F8KW70_PARAV|nr:hypothetical protein [Parachlamydia acanthamoebae]KIA78506.1 hypothetical protein DB43_DW00020 [Parachlamydia acanthamoebae]CCB85743.1 putative uncharacterized protein [Parachlamydia acanthamoebae UV-7]
MSSNSYSLAFDDLKKQDLEEVGFKPTLNLIVNPQYQKSLNSVEFASEKEKVAKIEGRLTVSF